MIDRSLPAPAILVIAHEVDASGARLVEAAGAEEFRRTDAGRMLHGLGLELARLAQALRGHHPALGRYRAEGGEAA